MRLAPALGILALALTASSAFAQGNQTENQSSDPDAIPALELTTFTLNVSAGDSAYYTTYVQAVNGVLRGVRIIDRTGTPAWIRVQYDQAAFEEICENCFAWFNVTASPSERVPPGTYEKTFTITWRGGASLLSFTVHVIVTARAEPQPTAGLNVPTVVLVYWSNGTPVVPGVNNVQKGEIFRVRYPAYPYLHVEASGECGLLSYETTGDIVLEEYVVRGECDVDVYITQTLFDQTTGQMYEKNTTDVKGWRGLGKYSFHVVEPPPPPRPVPCIEVAVESDVLTAGSRVHLRAYNCTHSREPWDGIIYLRQQNGTARYALDFVAGEAFTTILVSGSYVVERPPGFNGEFRAPQTLEIRRAYLGQYTTFQDLIRGRWNEFYLKEPVDVDRVAVEEGKRLELEWAGNLIKIRPPPGSEGPYELLVEGTLTDDYRGHPAGTEVQLKLILNGEVKTALSDALRANAKWLVLIAVLAVVLIKREALADFLYGREGRLVR